MDRSERMDDDRLFQVVPRDEADRAALRAEIEGRLRARLAKHVGQEFTRELGVRMVGEVLDEGFSFVADVRERRKEEERNDG